MHTYMIDICRISYHKWDNTRIGTFWSNKNQNRDFHSGSRQTYRCICTLHMLLKSHFKFKYDMKMTWERERSSKNRDEEVVIRIAEDRSFSSLWSSRLLLHWALTHPHTCMHACMQWYGAVSVQFNHTLCCLLGIKTLVLVHFSEW